MKTILVCVALMAVLPTLSGLATQPGDEDGAAWLAKTFVGKSFRSHLSSQGAETIQTTTVEKLEFHSCDVEERLSITIETRLPAGQMERDHGETTLSVHLWELMSDVRIKEEKYPPTVHAEPESFLSVSAPVVSGKSIEATGQVNGQAMKVALKEFGIISITGGDRDLAEKTAKALSQVIEKCSRSQKTP
jgi:hypothetical protein